MAVLPTRRRNRLRRSRPPSRHHADPSFPSSVRASGQAAAKPADTPAAKPTQPPTLAPTLAPTQPPTSTPVPPTPNAEQRVAAAQGAVASGDFPTAIDQLRALREDPAIKADPKVAPMVDDTLRMTHVVYGRQLLEQNRLDDSYGQFAEALKIAPNDPEALDGQKRVILSKNYALMEAAWGKDDDAAIKPLEENMILDPEFRDTRSKLYSALIGKADRMLAGGDRDGAFPVLMRALEVLPDGRRSTEAARFLHPDAAPCAADTGAVCAAAAATAAAEAAASTPAATPAPAAAAAAAATSAAAPAAGAVQATRSPCLGSRSNRLHARCVR